MEHGHSHQTQALPEGAVTAQDPVCGMALEPVFPTDAASPELAGFSRRMRISIAAAVPLILLTMGGLVALPVRNRIGHRFAVWVEFLLATPIARGASAPFVRRGWVSITNRSPNMWTLISASVGAAWLYSIVATFLPGLFPEQYRMGHGGGTYIEAAVAIVALVFVRQVLELRARKRTGHAIPARLDLAPKTAQCVPDDGTQYDAPLKNMQQGDRLRTRPKDSLPVDGVVIGGHSSVDESLITREPVPVEKGLGDAVTGKTINKNGCLVIKARRVATDTVLAQIIEMVSNAHRSRPRSSGWPTGCRQSSCRPLS